MKRKEKLSPLSKQTLPWESTGSLWPDIPFTLFGSTGEKVKSGPQKISFYLILEALVKKSKVDPERLLLTFGLQTLYLEET